MGILMHKYFSTSKIIIDMVRCPFMHFYLFMNKIHIKVMANANSALSID